MKMPSKLEVLKDIHLGQRVAEEEADDLQKYFVQTSEWEQLAAGKIDVVYGPKGSGKSALYNFLLQQQEEFEGRGIIIRSAENPRGTTVFKALVTNPPPSELEFVSLWKLYVLVMVGRTLRERKAQSEEAKTLVAALEQASLLPLTESRSSYFKAAQDYLATWLGRKAETVEYEMGLDPTTGLPTAIRRKVKYAKDGKVKLARMLDDLPIDDYLGFADQALERIGLVLWLAFDRLDVAFTESPDLERNALRALFRAYNDLKGKTRIRLKIFVRDDVWRRIIQGGFSEASHITRSLHIEWSEENLLNLVVLRLMSSSKLCLMYRINSSDVKSSYDKQVYLFYKVFPEKVDTGKNPKTLGWIIGRTSDGSGKGRPREVIHLVDAARQEQISALQRGAKGPGEQQLIDRSSIKGALPLVSKVFFEQTMLAEYPDLKDRLERLDGEKATQKLSTLRKIWDVSEMEAAELAKRLLEIGFFEKKGREETEFRVPFLLRPALSMIQGKAS